MVKHDGGPVCGGIDTHADTHHVAVIDVHGRPLGDVRVPATAAGYRQAVRFIGRWPQVAKVGVECTGSAPGPMRCSTSPACGGASREPGAHHSAGRH
jgi:hypothetical protein